MKVRLQLCLGKCFLLTSESVCLRFPNVCRCRLIKNALGVFLKVCKLENNILELGICVCTMNVRTMQFWLNCGGVPLYELIRRKLFMSVCEFL